MEKDIYFFKYNEDDILEILTEYLAEQCNAANFNSKAILLGTPGKDLRLICAVTDDIEGESIHEMNDINLLDLDAGMDFNGTHNQEGMADSELFKAIDKMISSGTF